MKFNPQIFILIFAAWLLSLTSISCTHSLLEQAFVVNESVLKKRVLQTQRFENINEKQLLSAIIGLMQDLNFRLDEGDKDLGVFTGSKRRSFIRNLPVTRMVQRYETRTQVINGKIVSRPALVNVPVTVFEPFVFIEETRIAIVIYPVSQRKDRVKGNFLVRANLQKMTWNESTGGITQAGPFGDSAFYESFFSILSKSIFLETNL